ncbi:BRISC and BRCA1-A complex member 1 isoform X2 [Phycodurus eques]|uniref:BRISC and BRCA1-A complex member 1 isoform X2 n=1 Tax=Phycodurus eques TaxID=693459 RepID=UPI002ACECAF6|nr:BRISC and BRCA1-A complex member 1 isoform X2 [Phycodurus eques]
METPEPGPADGEERQVELRPRTRSNPEGAEDRRSSTGSLGGGGNPSLSQPAVGSRVEGEGEASTSDSPPSSATATISTAVAQTVVPVAAATTVQLALAAASKERSKPTPQQPALIASVPPPAEYQIRVPRVNCPEKVIICLDLSEEMCLPKLESFNGSKTNALNISQKMIEMFVRTKHKIDKRHEFALVVVNDDALWLSGFTSDPRELCSCLYDLETNTWKIFSVSFVKRLNCLRWRMFKLCHLLTWCGLYLFTAAMLDSSSSTHLRLSVKCYSLPTFSSTWSTSTTVRKITGRIQAGGTTTLLSATLTQRACAIASRCP